MIWYKLPEDPTNYVTITNRFGCLFFVAINQFMMSMQPVILTFPTERALFLKEENSRMYTVSAYYFGRSFTEFPTLLLFPTIFSLISYWMVGFNMHEPYKFPIFLLICILQSMAGNALGLMVGTLFSDPKVAAAVAPMMFIPFVLFCGYYK